MKLYYVNDERQPVTIQVNHSFIFDPSQPFREPKIEYFALQPLEAKLFDIDAPEGSIPYVKRWENRHVLLSYQNLSELVSRLGDAEG